MNKPRYPIYVISKGRYENCLTAKFLIEDKVDFRLVVEPQEKIEYVARFGEHRVLTLPFQNLGLGSIPARNWCWEHSIKEGHKRHWILDDNIRCVRRLHHGKRLKCNSNKAFIVTEDFTDRYTNIGISGLNYTCFAINVIPPFYLNNHVYSTLLIDNKLSYRWRGRYNEDTDLCLQVLSGGLCTVLINVFLIDKMATMTMKGGNADELYKGDGRLKMARALERIWPRVVKTDRRFKRPQHIVAYQWKKFDTKLIRRNDINWNNMKPNNYGMKLMQVGSEIKSQELKDLINKV